MHPAIQRCSAAVLAREFGTIAPGVLRDLRRGEVVMQRTASTGVGEVFRMQTAPPQAVVGRGRKVVAKSRRSYGRPRAAVEDRIARWLRS